MKAVDIISRSMMVVPTDALEKLTASFDRSAVVVIDSASHAFRAAAERAPRPEKPSRANRKDKRRARAQARAKSRAKR